MTRPSWDEYFLGIAKAVAKRATCSRASIGCVIVNEDHNIIATGYNGAPAGLRHCDHGSWRQTDVTRIPDTTDGHCDRAQHAERNAVAQAAKQGVRLKGSTCYLTAAPCLECARILVSAGIKKVAWEDSYKSPGLTQSEAVALFEEARVPVITLP